MKEQILLYGVCLAISVAAVAITSFIKLIVGGIARKCAHDLSGNVKEYIFAPMAIVIAAAGLYLWLDNFCEITFDEKFILIWALFSIGTMVLYLLIFQPTRKFAMRIIRVVAQYFKVPAVVEAVKSVLTEAEALLNPTDEDLQLNAENSESTQHAGQEPLDSGATDNEADKLRAMVEIIKNQ